MKRFSNLNPIWYIVAVCALLAPLGLFSSKLKPLEGNVSPIYWVKEAVYPLEYAFNAVYTKFSQNWQRLTELNRASMENISLQQEVNRLQLQQITYEELKQENEQLRDLLSFQKLQTKKSVPVQLYASREKDIFQALRSNKGYLDGLAVGMPVVTPRGIIGRIIRTGLKHSDIQLLTDPNFHVDVLIQRTRTRAVLQGDGDGKSLLQLHHRTLVKIGDTVVTSGIVGAFPKGIPVGRITKISYGNDQVSQLIELEPWVKPYNEEYALVIRKFDPSIKGIVESTTRDWLERNTSRNSGAKKGTFDSPKGG